MNKAFGMTHIINPSIYTNLYEKETLDKVLKMTFNPN